MSLITTETRKETEADTIEVHTKCPKHILLGLKQYAFCEGSTISKVALDAWKAYLERPEIRKAIEKEFNSEDVK